ncbi:pilus assembly protein [Undibacterium parvum]|uniref:VWA domain-containing protein n=1 Tax=Undibacterium parvum TaxID=401471 RepID=A0A3S9HIY3_9BURK|nr:PilC/PilY family type IV pilus protein [Undibacterium parvum]AZP12060.1 VWA domain-containing protein [Undibacterium parvum]
MSQQRFNLNQISVAICLAFPALTLSAFAADYYPALPPTLSTSVTPNVMLHIDNSGSMRNNGADGLEKMASARGAARDLIDRNPTLRWGLFSFDKNATQAGGRLVAPVGSTVADLKSAIDTLNPDTWTPLGEALYEITRYFGGQTSYFSKIAGNYTSPIQYRCQKNFVIVVTDGVATYDDTLPGINNKPAETYTSYNASNVAESRTFKICKDTSNVSSYLTCPAKVEGSTVNNPFTGTADDASSTNYGRSIRDVAMYAYDADFRVGGNDKDGKSFDDPKFRKQNISTYTVGFNNNDPILVATATVGHGSYSMASTKDALVASLQNAIDSIVASTSNAGGVATQSETTAAGNRVFQPVFNPNGWYGELRCFLLNADGTVGAGCTPNPKAVIPAAASRKVYSSKVAGTTPTTTAFDFVINSSFMTPAQKLLLGADATAQNNTINFVRGDETNTSFRSRAGIFLGDIVDGQPVVVTKPSGSTNDGAYSSFISSNAARNMVLVGANDGMMHAFDIDKMTELMGYIPSTVYPNLKALTAKDYGVSAGTPHAYHVNGSMRQQDIKAGGAWKTIVAGGLGQGGRGYYAVDATSATQITGLPSSVVKWEWNNVNDTGMGYAFGVPVIYNVRNGDKAVVPAVILSNGYQNKWVDGATTQVANESVLYILKADDGTLLKKIVVPNSTGLSSPAGLDFGQDGVLDYVYAGDVDGKLWRFDLTSTDAVNFKVVTTPIFDAGAGHPIVMRPGIMAANKASDGTSLGNVIFFGTGQLLTNLDRSDITTQTLYGVLDKMEASPTTVTLANLQQQAFATPTISLTSKRVGTYRKMDTTTAAAKAFDLASAANWAAATPKLGWYLDLPDSSERLVTSPMVFDDKVLFGTGVPVSTEKCLPGGKGWIIGLNPMSGSVTRKANKGTASAFSFIDIDGDGKSSAADKIGTGIDDYLSAYQKDGIPTEMSYVATTAKLTGPINQNTDGWDDIGSVIALREANSMAVYTGNAPAGTKRGKTILRPPSEGKGSIYGGTVGNDDLGKDSLTGPGADKIRIETTLWREIK